MLRCEIRAVWKQGLNNEHVEVEDEFCNWRLRFPCVYIVSFVRREIYHWEIWKSLESFRKSSPAFAQYCLVYSFFSWSAQSGSRGCIEYDSLNIITRIFFVQVKIIETKFIHLLFLSYRDEERCERIKLPCNNIIATIARSLIDFNLSRRNLLIFYFSIKTKICILSKE